MGKDRDPQGLGELQVQFEEKRKSAENYRVVGSGGLVLLGFGTQFGIGWVSFGSAIVGSALFIGGFFYGEFQERRVQYLKGQIDGIIRESQRTASLQRPLN